MWQPQPRRPITDGLGLEPKASTTRGPWDPIPGSGILLYIYHSDNLRTKTMTPQVETAPYGVKTPAPLADH